MIRPLSLLIGLRYTRAKRRNHFISFIALASMLGIALGVTVLITVLSVMNGFDYQIRSRFFALVPPITVLTNQKLSKSGWQASSQAIKTVSGIHGLAPFVKGNGMIVHHGHIMGVAVMGVAPKQEPQVSQLAEKMVIGKLATLIPDQFNIVIGQGLAARLGLIVGDKVNVLTPQTTVSLAGVFPRYKTFTISGVFHASSGFGFDNSMVFINWHDAERLFPGKHGSRGFHVAINNLYQAPYLSQQLEAALPGYYFVTNWTRQYGTFFQALKLEKTILFVILLLMIGVAVFNLVSTLVMVVNDKRSDIAILRTLGATPGMILRTILVQGATIGLVGTLLGLLGGLLLAANATAIVDTVQNIFHVQFINASVFFVNYLPSRIELSDVVLVCSLSFGLSLLATVYPAWVAFRTQPAEALRYE